MANYTSTGILNTTVSPTTEKGSFSFTIKLISTLLLITTIILTLLGNSLVIRAFIVFRKLQNVTNYFVVSLAVTDILVALFSMPVWTVYLLTGIQHYGKNFFFVFSQQLIIRSEQRLCTCVPAFSRTILFFMILARSLYFMLL